jgi:hypothetical protein
MRAAPILQMNGATRFWKKLSIITSNLHDSSSLDENHFKNETKKWREEL